MLRVDALRVSYGEVPVLRDLSMSCGAGEVVALLGPNGAGKTTLLRTISGLHAPDAGSIAFLDRQIARRAPHRIAREGIAHVPEGRGILGELTVEENLRLGARAGGGSGPGRFDDVYGLFPRLAERRGQLAGMLSGGEQQMLAIGRALLSRPKLLLIDELSLGLAPKIASDLLRLVRRLAEGGLGVVLVEQNVQETLNIAHRAYVLVHGRIRFEGACDRLASREDILRLYMGAAAD